MKHSILWILAIVFAAACGGARQATAPIYELRAIDGPLTYSASVENLTVIETPGGEQEIDATVNAVLRITYMSATDEGLPFEFTFDELAAQGAAAVDMSSAVGETFGGVVREGGEVAITELPELDIPGFSAATVEQLVNPLAVPLPPGGMRQEEAWTLSRSSEPPGGLEGIATFEGSARIAGDSTWNEIPVAIIVASGEVRQRASGTPAGAPGEVDFDTEGESETTYMWDPARGIVVQVAVDTEMDGSVSVQGMVFPLRVESRASYSLVE